MKAREKPSLAALNSFGVTAEAALRIDIESEEDVLALPAFDRSRDLLLGGGSNVLLVSDVPGTVYLNRIMGKQVVEQGDGGVVVEIGAGENWHDFVIWCLAEGFSGIENLSLIPGSVGAAPIQNIGAYGVELSSVLVSVTAWDWHKLAWLSARSFSCICSSLSLGCCLVAKSFAWKTVRCSLN
jgi:UDP-N-acetylmuramate dehydrogenase